MLKFGGEKKKICFLTLSKVNKESHIYRYIYKMVEGGGSIFAPKKKFKVTLMKKIFDSKIILLFSTFQVFAWCEGNDGLT